MSRIVDKKIPCPRCHAEVPFTFYEVINTEENPELKEKVMDGSVFDLDCPLCHRSSRIGYPLLYHDPLHSAMFMMTEDRTGEPILALVDFLRNSGFLPDDPHLMLRGVHQPPELSEKVLIADEELDDRVVEILKSMISAAWRTAHQNNEPDLVVLDVVDDELTFIILDSPDGMPELQPFFMDAYDAALKTYKPFFPADPADNLFVDADWVRKLYEPGSVLH